MQIAMFEKQHRRGENIKQRAVLLDEGELLSAYFLAQLSGIRLANVPIASSRTLTEPANSFLAERLPMKLIVSAHCLESTITHLLIMTLIINIIFQSWHLFRFLSLFLLLDSHGSSSSSTIAFYFSPLTVSFQHRAAPWKNLHIKEVSWKLNLV